MILQREPLLSTLRAVSIALSGKAVLEQSDCFVFRGGAVIAYNDEMLVTAPLDLGFEVAVRGEDVIDVLSRFPDDSVDLSLREQSVIVKGKKRTAGITCLLDIRLPFDGVPMPQGKWKRLGKDTAAHLLQAARCCGRDVTNLLTTCVHVTPDYVEACDNNRFFRAEGLTGLSASIIIPAAMIDELSGMNIRQVQVGDGWVYFKNKAGVVFCVRCLHGKYHEGLDKLMEVPDGEEVRFPKALGEVVQRAEVMLDKGYDARVRLRVVDSVLTMTSRKEGGWFREHTRIDYVGKPMDFEVHPQFLAELVDRTRKVVVGKDRMRVITEGGVFVVSLNATATEEE